MSHHKAFLIPPIRSFSAELYRGDGIRRGVSFDSPDGTASPVHGLENREIRWCEIVD